MIPPVNLTFDLVLRWSPKLFLVPVAALGCLLSFSAIAQPVPGLPQPGVTYETRVFLPNADAPMGVDEAIFRWALNDDRVYSVGDEITEADLEFIELKIDLTVAEFGEVITDTIISGGSVVPIPGRGSLSDVIWEFDFFDPLTTPNYESLVANIGPGEATAFRNMVDPPTGSVGTYYQVVDGSNRGLTDADYYEVVAYPPGTSNAPGGPKEWDLARLDAETRTFYGQSGYLATITSAAEDALLYTLVDPVLGTLEAWVGALQDDQACTDTFPTHPFPGAKDHWVWLNNEGCVDGIYTNWLPNEPNDSAGGESKLAINLLGANGWNDEGALSLVGGYVVEYPRTTGAAVFITRFVDGELDVGAYETTLIQRSGIVSTVSVRDLPVPTGTDGTIFNIATVSQEGLVLEGGIVNVDVCVAPDQREGFIIRGEGRQFKGKGKAIGLDTEEAEVVRVFNRKPLAVSSLAGTGTCTGLLPNVAPDDPYQTWEDLLAVIDLTYPEDYRGFVGRVDLTPETSDDEEDWVEAVWFMVVVVRSEANFGGPVSVVNRPEALINFDQTPEGQRPVDYPASTETAFSGRACENPLSYRPIDLAGNILAFDGTVDVEDSLIPKTVQCNRSWSLTRRTTHVVPGRLEGDVNWSSVEAIEAANVESQLTGLQATLAEAGAICTALTFPDLLDQLQFFLNQADSSYANADYADAVTFLEAFAQLALDAGPSGDIPGNGFATCPPVDNVSGNLVARSLAASFTIFDRIIHGANPVPPIYDPDILIELTPELGGGGPVVE